MEMVLAARFFRNEKKTRLFAQNPYDSSRKAKQFRFISIEANKLYSEKNKPFEAIWLSNLFDANVGEKQAMHDVSWSS